MRTTFHQFDELKSEGGKKYVRNKYAKYAHRLWRPNHWPRRISAGADTRGNETHRPVPHHKIVQTLVETLGFRHIGVVHDEYAARQTA